MQGKLIRGDDGVDKKGRQRCHRGDRVNKKKRRYEREGTKGGRGEREKERNIYESESERETETEKETERETEPARKRKKRGTQRKNTPTQAETQRAKGMERDKGRERCEEAEFRGLRAPEGTPPPAHAALSELYFPQGNWHWSLFSATTGGM